MGESFEKKYRLNQRITAPKVRLVGERTNEVMETHQALKKALEQGLDLIELAPNADPPVVKILDRKKFAYQEAKRVRKVSKSKKSKLKEIRISPTIAQNDFETKLNRARKFLAIGDQVKINVWLKGRLVTRPELAQTKMALAIKYLENEGKTTGEPKWQGKYLLVATLSAK